MATIIHLNRGTPPTLAEIGNFLVRTRRAARRLAQALDEQHDSINARRRQVGMLRAAPGAKFNAARIARIESEIGRLESACREDAEALRKLGHALMDAAPLLDTCTTREQRSELLNVNPADRGDLTDEDGIVRIVFAHGLEDSAERRHAEFNDGPLFRAMHTVFAEFLRTPEGQAMTDEAFGSGGPFGFLMPRTLH